MESNQNNIALLSEGTVIRTKFLRSSPCYAQMTIETYDAMTGRMDGFVTVRLDAKKAIELASSLSAIAGYINKDKTCDR